MPPLKSKYEDMPGEEVIRRGRELDLYSSTFLKTPAPAHDPIFTPLFTSLIGAGFMAGSSTGVSILTAIASTAITLGFNLSGDKG